MKRWWKDESLAWYKQDVYDDIISKIRNNEVTSGKLRRIGFALGKVLTDYISSLGYDGIITLQGGEGREKGDPIHVGNHETYVVFDPGKIKEMKEEETN